jgi:hypothetical protein
MHAHTIRVESPQEALIVEQALAMYREMREAAACAADGEVLSVAESLAVISGREFARRSLETVLAEETGMVEKKTALPDAAPAEERANTAAGKRGRSSRRPAR